MDEKLLEDDLVLTINIGDTDSEMFLKLDRIIKATSHKLPTEKKYN